MKPDRPANTIVGQVDNDFLSRMMHFSPTAVVVWLALANRANKAGECWPSYGDLREDTGIVSRSTIAAAIKELIEKGEISVVKGSANHTNNRYRFCTSPKNGLVQKVDRTSPKNGPELVQKLDSNQTHVTKHKTKHDRSTSKSPYTDDFEAWWKVYPRRVGKRKAFTAWKAALKNVGGNGEAPTTLLKITRQFAASAAGNAGDFVPHPTTWLNQGRYEDNPSEWEAKEATQPRKKLEYRG